MTHSNRSVISGPEQAEFARLSALHSYDVLDTPKEEIFDEVTRLAASLVGTPMALISFVDHDRQWFKARVGIDVTQTPLDVSFCKHAINGRHVFVVPDASVDQRFSDNPLVVGEPRIRFYAGAPLIDSHGYALGTLCVIGQTPRDLPTEQRDALEILGRHVVAQLELRSRLAEVTRHNVNRAGRIREMRAALETHQFALHYQPKIAIGTGAVIGVEALIRWMDPVRGLVPPAEFIPFLEDTGLIVDVGNWALREAAADYHRWQSLGLSPPPIAVNVSPRQLKNVSFIQQFREVTRDGTRLDIEITEETFLEDVKLAIIRLDEARASGAHIAIDDFGAGYSSLKYLRTLPLDTLKIDRSFVESMTMEDNSKGIVSSIISLAHGLNLNVVAEGVESEDQLELLQELGCDQVQGYFTGGPTSKEMLDERLKT